jgi:hypothetical protein
MSIPPPSTPFWRPGVIKVVVQQLWSYWEFQLKYETMRISWPWYNPIYATSRYVVWNLRCTTCTVARAWHYSDVDGRLYIKQIQPKCESLRIRIIIYITYANAKYKILPTCMWGCKHVVMHACYNYMYHAYNASEQYLLHNDAHAALWKTHIGCCRRMMHSCLPCQHSVPTWCSCVYAVH